MNKPAPVPTAVNTPTRFVEVKGRRLAYRELGQGVPIILCLRFRGILDSWDPAFLDALAAHHRVITFDYSGLGQSTGTPSYVRTSLAQDAVDLADALGLERFIIGGWSLGGIAAQVVTRLHPERVIKIILIGTTPPGKVRMPAKPIFYERALKPENDLDDEVVLFFHPESQKSRAAAVASHNRIAARTTDTSPAIPINTVLKMLAESKGDDVFVDDSGYRDFLKTTTIPILVISGDQEIVFPVENWFDLTPQTKSVHLMVFPQMGHGPQHEAPQVCADLIASFIKNR
ncbi:alpha/beta fold hydrolase [Vitiosangium sp. GDMCC 1.1324]|uniref:alpha/beta fold hydrolase n=1 Tax=Vitiosangium sp. (strain GDMCC 1.1324) TaxID=2138576 RepID=UPI000D3C20D5|nr:alpha/beta hydrolase [Vitiosangium sp. GDMCC 1.1324]PTL76508.1 alpha/beta hydrolase [Vitiosangium sp. GDMCC 1.1324]